MLRYSLLAGGLNPPVQRRKPTYLYQGIAATTPLTMEYIVADLWRTWTRGEYRKLTHKLRSCFTFTQDLSKTSDAMRFLAVGGVDVLCCILCDPFTPYTFVKSSVKLPHFRSWNTSDLTEVYVETLHLLTDLLAAQNDLGWVLYDRYPGLFFRLLEFLPDAYLWGTAAGLLEHLLSCVGPVLEIAKTPLLIHAIRVASPVQLAAFCRFITLLILPGLAQRQNPVMSRRLKFPENVMVLRRVQRIIDSNVLWMMQEKQLMEKLIQFCELRPSGVRVQQGGRSMTLFNSVQEPQAFPPAFGMNDLSFRNAAAVAGGGPPQMSGGIHEQNSSGGGTDDGSTWAEEEEDASGISGSGDVTADFVFEQGSLPSIFSALELLLGGHRGDRSTGDAGSNGAGYNSGRTRARPAATPQNPPSATGVAGNGSGALWPPRETAEQRVAINQLESFLRATGYPVEHGDAQGSVMASIQQQLSTPSADDPLNSPDDGSGGISPSRFPTGDLAGVNPSQLIQWMIDDEWIGGDAGDPSLEPSMRVSWLVGVCDTRQRWRLRDPTLTMEKDDNRPYMFSVLGSQFKRLGNPVQTFTTANDLLCRIIIHSFPQKSQISDSTNLQHVVESQSEVLFLLNMLLSTFYFSDSWRMMKECQWLPRSVKMFVEAFGLDPRLPTLVDVPPHVQLSAELRRLPRFQEPHPSPASEELSTAVSTAATSDEGVIDVPPPDDRVQFYPSGWCILPLLKLLGKTAEEFTAAPDTLTNEDFDSHQHGPDTMRKMELLRGIYEFWNAQDRRERQMVVSDEKIVASADMLAVNITYVILMSKEDSCVDTCLYQTLEAYLRVFFFGRLTRDSSSSVQTTIGATLLPSMLGERLYNGTLVPGLSGSMHPAKRLCNMFGLLGELVKYHHGNLTILCDYVRGAVPVSHLNDTLGNTNRQHSIIMSTQHEQVEEILKHPPLERGEFEPFGSVLLRRLFSCGRDSNLLLRGLLLSLTPGLRSTGNYIHKPLQEDILDELLPESQPGIGRMSDIISGDPVRLAYIHRVSRYYTTQLSLIGADKVRRREVMHELLTDLLHTPHRMSVEERPFPGFFSAADYSLACGEVPLPSVGPPPRLSAPLFYKEDGATSAEVDAARLQSLTPLVDFLLAEPYKLIFSAICGLRVESMDDNSRLSVVSTTLLIFLRVARLAPRGDEAAALHATLDSMRYYAAVVYQKWKLRQMQEKQSREKTGNDGVPAHQARCQSACTCAAGTRSGESIGDDGDEADSALGGASTGASSAPLRRRCLSFMVYGSCRPAHDTEVYHRAYGGCFFRSFFRVLCVWVGYYAACQRYVATMFLSTEVPFGEFKTMCLYLLGVLPDYFMPPLLEGR